MKTPSKTYQKEAVLRLHAAILCDLEVCKYKIDLLKVNAEAVNAEAMLKVEKSINKKAARQ